MNASAYVRVAPVLNTKLARSRSRVILKKIKHRICGTVDGGFEHRAVLGVTVKYKYCDDRNLLGHS